MPKPDLSEPLLTCCQLAERLNVRPATIRAWTCRRRIPFVRVGSRMVRYRESDCRALIKTVPALEDLARSRGGGANRTDGPQDAI